jgi:predicted dienelactone hydrolase
MRVNDQQGTNSGGVVGPVCGAASAVLLALLTACATNAPTREDAAFVREFAAKGYASIDQGAVTTTASTWLVSGQAVRVVLTQPVRAGVMPVVVYLPGLGESSDSGEQWRTAWASAGYAVVSVQLLDDDASAWTSELARTGEFKALGRQRYAGVVMSRRVQLLADLVAEGRRRSLAGEAGWQRIDWNSMAIAGFDLGAYTAMAVAGEHVRDAEDTSHRVRVRAAVALSPYASVAAGALDTRYRDIQAPVMSVTSDVDGDALGLVEGAYLRGAPFTHMVGPDKYLLSLQGLPHAKLSGSADAKSAKAAADSTRRSQDAAGNSAGRDPGQHRRGGKQGGPGDDSGPGSDRSASGDGPGSVGLSPGALQLRVIAVQDISTAFLDAYLKDDRLAREWLDATAGRWLGTVGNLRRK